MTKLRRRLAIVTSAAFLPERVSMLYRLCGTDVPIIFFAVGVTSFALWGNVDGNLIALWFVCLGVASMVRYTMAWIYRRRQPASDDAAKWENYFCLCSALVGAVWGVMLTYIGLSPTSPQDLIVTFLIASIAMGLPSSLAPSPKAFISYIVAVLAPEVAMLMAFGGGSHTSTAMLMLVLAGVVAAMYVSNHLALLDTLAYGNRNTVLLEDLRVAEKSLIAALTEQETIFDTAAVGIAFISQRTVVKCNSRFAEILGYEKEDMPGQDTRVWFQSEEDFLIADSLANARMSERQNDSSELHLRRKDGSLIWVFADSRAINPANPKAGVIIGIGDITERKLAEEALHRTKERLDLAMQSSAISIWEWDAARGTIYLDAGLAQMTGDEPHERWLTLEEMALLVHPDDVAMMRQAQDECFKGLAPVYNVEHRLKTVNGEWVWILSHGRVVERARDRRVMRVAGTNMDISQRKLAEAELLSALRLEKELSERKSRFAMLTQHEFRTPLSTILSSAELLEHYAVSLSAGDRLAMLHGIQSGVKRMDALIDNVLMIGKAEAGTLKFAPTAVDLAQICEKAVEDLRKDVGAQYAISFERNFDRGSVNLDGTLLRRILGNLLSNAVKFSRAGSAVSLAVAERDGHAVIEVCDQGIGIPVEDQARLFETFHRASNVDNRQGAGLGLAVVKKAVELHGGTVSIESKVNAGTRVSLQLPLTGASRAA
ncbi:MAG: PAS domain-containing sensor histidine kinase [Burkholderiales bacterium]|nr:PAS domain-containing sensor histidine kinase [Burkholderiales bacterium]